MAKYKRRPDPSTTDGKPPTVDLFMMKCAKCGRASERMPDVPLVGFDAQVAWVNQQSCPCGSSGDFHVEGARMTNHDCNAECGHG